MVGLLAFKFLKIPPYTPAGFDLTAHNSEGGDDTTRPRRQGNKNIFKKGTIIN
jgi:hypothetical protein